LWLDDSFEVVLQDLGEVVCIVSTYILRQPSRCLTLKFRSTEIFQDLFPIRWVVIAAKIGLQLSAENLQCGALANTIGTNESQHLARTGHGQPVQLEAVRRVSMGDLGLEVRGQIDDVNGVKWALLGADTASYTQALGNKGDLGGGLHLNAQLAGAHDGTGLFAFLATFLRPCQEGTCFLTGWLLPLACTVMATKSTLATRIRTMAGQVG
jgi:hypothetical protein